jgi:ATP-dependent helicase/nuclease subunit A
MIARGDAVRDARSGELRRCTAGDVMILVRRRNPLFHEIIRALKRLDVPVGGADRMPLAEHAVFQDFVALGRFCRFPTDDLMLAGVLRSPLCDVSEDSLFDLAHGRDGSLWGALNRRADERAEWREARAFLGWAIGEAAQRPPFDFYGRVLSRLDAAGRSMRARLMTRLGPEAADAIEAFLGQALGAESRDVRDLERFLAAMAATDIEIKREQEDQGGEVRVMTAHGAKGLEAPIVILPDTTTKAVSQGGPLLDTGDGGYLWAPRKADDCPASSQARSLRERLSDEESLRLLYVALTRARDRLIVCGVQARPHLFSGSWRDYVDRAFARVAARPFALEGGAEGLRYGADPLTALPARAGAGTETALPDWARRPPPPEPAAMRYASPSTVTEETRGAAPSPLASVSGLGRFRRGDIIHRLLERLPDLPSDARASGAARLLAREAGLTEAQREEMAAAALAVLADARFAEVFGPGSRAEVALSGAAPGLPANLAISGRIDRLVVTPTRVLVVDFKTNRPAPDRIEDADSAYITQMALYRAVLGEVFPGRRIEAALVWTDGPRLMPVTENLMDQALDALAANG